MCTLTIYIYICYEVLDTILEDFTGALDGIKQFPSGISSSKAYQVLNDFQKTFITVSTRMNMSDYNAGKL